MLGLDALKGAPLRAPTQQRRAPATSSVSSVPPVRQLACFPPSARPFGAKDVASLGRRLGVAARYSATEQTANVPALVVERVEELLLPLPRASESAVDDPQLHNPLLRAQRLSTGWFGVILEWEGVLTQSLEEQHVQAWLQTATEFGYKRPFGQQLRRIKGVRDEVIVSRVFGWTHNPTVARQAAQRKGEIFQQLLGGRQAAPMLEARPFLEMLKRNGIPVALATPLSERKIEEELQRLNLRPYFDAIVTSDDSGSAEVEFYYAFAAQKVGRPPLRCIVIGESNTSVEASHELGMKSAVVTGNNPVYDFGSADLVVRNLSQLSFMNLKKLFGQENLVEPKAPLEDGQLERNPRDEYGEDGSDAFNDEFDMYHDDEDDFLKF